MNSIDVEQMGFAYNDVDMLRNISFDVEEEKFISILDPNGVGKSTLIYCINRLLEFIDGAICIDEKNVCEYSTTEDNIEHTYGQVQHCSIRGYPHMIFFGQSDGSNHFDDCVMIDSGLSCDCAFSVQSISGVLFARISCICYQVIFSARESRRVRRFCDCARSKLIIFMRINNGFRIERDGRFFAYTVDYCYCSSLFV